MDRWNALQQKDFPYSDVQNGQMVALKQTDSFPYFKDEDFYAFSSGTEEGGSCPTLQLNTEEDHLKNWLKSWQLLFAI